MAKKHFSIFLLFTVSFWAFSIIFPSSAHALEKIFFPERDTYIIPGGGNSGYGFEQTLLFENNVEGSFSWRSYVYIMFEIDSLPKEAVIDKAILSLNLVEDEADNCSVQVQRQGEPWNEYENSFSLGYTNTGIIYDIAYVVGTGVYNWDITQLLSEWHSGKFPNYGVVMFATDECRKLFASRHYNDQNLWPRLTVSYHFPPSPTPTPTLTPSPTPTLTPTPQPTLSDKAMISPTLTAGLTPTLTPILSSEPAVKEERDNKTSKMILLIITGITGLGVASFFIWKNKEKFFRTMIGTKDEISLEGEEGQSLESKSEDKLPKT